MTTYPQSTPGQPGDGVHEFRLSGGLLILSGILVVGVLAMAVFMPLDALREGRMNAGVIGFTIGAVLFALLIVAFIVWAIRTPLLRIDQQGIHRLGPGPKSFIAWGDIKQLAPGTNGMFQIVTYQGWLKPSGKRSLQKTMFIRPGSFRNGGSLAPLIADGMRRYAASPPAA